MLVRRSCRACRHILAIAISWQYCVVVTALRFHRVTSVSVLALATGIAVAACGGNPSAADSGGLLRVVTTVAPITSIAATIAGDRAKIDGLVPEGTNSHTFEPPPSAARVLSEADLYSSTG